MIFFNKKLQKLRVLLFTYMTGLIGNNRILFKINAQKKEKFLMVKSFLLSMIIAVGFILAGCQSAEPGDINARAVEKEQSTADAGSLRKGVNTVHPVLKKEGPVEQCQRELSALGKINPSMYEKRRVAFSGLLKNASVYSSLRQDINSQTKETVDALYKYKTQKLCHDIEQDLQQALISYGENLQ